MFELGRLTISAGLDVRIFSSSGGSGVIFCGAVDVAATGSLTIQGFFSTIGFTNHANIAGGLVFSGSMALTDGACIVAAVVNSGTISIHGGVTMIFPDESSPTISGALPGAMIVTLGRKAVGSLSFDGDTMSGTGPGGNWPAWDSGPEESANGLGFVLYSMGAATFTWWTALPADL